MPTGSHEMEGSGLANGRYLVTQKLGEGGMGTIYRARDRHIETDVVIKIPRLSMMDDPEFAGRFMREIRSLVKLSHPHIVKVSDVGTWEGTPFAVMQFLPGGTLEDRRPIGADGQLYPVEPESISTWLTAVAAALDYVHSQGYVHRDVKPANILFDAQGHAFLSDFGVAKVLTSATASGGDRTAMTGAGMLIGTPEYMAPELIMGESFDGRADQYALAITIYELLCGRRPFEDDTKTKLLVLHTSKAPPVLTEWHPGLPEVLSQAVLKGLNKNPNDRYPSCAALAAAVAETTRAAIPHDGRVRLACPGCGKTGSMEAADYARLRKAGRRPRCSACKVPLDVAAHETAADKMTAPSAPSPRVTPARSIGPQPTMIERPPATPRPAAKTLVENLSPGPDQSQKLAPRGRTPQPTLIEQPSPAQRPVTKTLVEMPALPSTEWDLGATPGAAVVPNQTTIWSTPTEVAPAHPAAPYFHLDQRWIAIAGGAGASVLALAVLAVWMIPRQGTGKAAVDVKGNLPVVTGSLLAARPLPSPPHRESATGAVMPAPPGAPAVVAEMEPTNVEKPRSVVVPNPENSSTGPSVADRRDVLPAPRATADEPGPGEPVRPAFAATTAREVNPERHSTRQRAAFDPIHLRGKPETKYSIKKVLSASRSYIGRLVVPTGMFHLKRAPDDQVHGRRKYVVIERKMESQRNDSLGMTSAEAVALDVEPNLARRLEAVGAKKLANNMAIVTLWFPDDGQAMVVRVDLLQHYQLGFKKATFYPEGDIDYFTLRISPEGEEAFKANDDEWEQPDRMLHFARVYKSRVSHYKRVLQNGERAHLDSTMTNLYQGMLRNAAAREAEQQQLRQALTPR